MVKQLGDLLGVAEDKINEDRLYRTLDALPPHKEKVEVFLKERLGELFDLKYDLLLYDATSTYFEGQVAGGGHQIREGLDVKLCPSPDGVETFILCRSADRQQKEKAIHARFEQRREEGLKKIEGACRRGNYTVVTIAQRVGRLFGQNTRSAGLFEVEVLTEADGRTGLRWAKKPAWREWVALSEGCYVLRSNVNTWSAEELWQALFS